VPLDLLVTQSVVDFAKHLTTEYQHVDVLVNNAGFLSLKPSPSSDGFECGFQAMHLGHFLLTRLLLPIIPNSGTTNERMRASSID